MKFSMISASNMDISLGGLELANDYFTNPELYDTDSSKTVDKIEKPKITRENALSKFSLIKPKEKPVTDDEVLSDFEAPDSSDSTFDFSFDEEKLVEETVDKFIEQDEEGAEALALFSKLSNIAEDLSEDNEFDIDLDSDEELNELLGTDEDESDEDESDEDGWNIDSLGEDLEDELDEEDEEPNWDIDSLGDDLEDELEDELDNDEDEEQLDLEDDFELGDIDLSDIQNKPSKQPDKQSNNSTPISNQEVDTSEEPEFDLSDFEDEDEPDEEDEFDLSEFEGDDEEEESEPEFDLSDFEDESDDEEELETPIKEVNVQQIENKTLNSTENTSQISVEPKVKSQSTVTPQIKTNQTTSQSDNLDKTLKELEIEEMRLKIALMEKEMQLMKKKESSLDAANSKRESNKKVVSEKPKQQVQAVQQRQVPKKIVITPEMYADMPVDKLYAEVKQYMTRLGVKQRAVDISALNTKFGDANIRKLIQKSYLIKIGKGVTAGR